MGNATLKPGRPDGQSREQRGVFVAADGVNVSAETNHAGQDNEDTNQHAAVGPFRTDRCVRFG